MQYFNAYFYTNQSKWSQESSVCYEKNFTYKVEQFQFKFVLKITKNCKIFSSLKRKDSKNYLNN